MTIADHHPRALSSVFAPRSIAICGASREAGSLGNRAVTHLRAGRYRGRIVPINPRYAGQVLDGLQWYGAVGDCPDPIDHAVLLVKSQLAPGVLAACAAAGVGSASILAGGFAETGAAGRERQSAIAAIIARTGMPLLGPNCLGFVNVAERVFASPGSVFQSIWPESGPLAIISQSGAVAGDILAQARFQGVETSLWISTGNEVDITVADCIGYACGIDAVSVIAVYLESIRDIAVFRAAARQARAMGKTILALHPGRTEAARRAVQSHTAAMVTADALYDAVFDQLGIGRVDSIRDMIDVVRAAIHLRPGPGGLAIASSSGGSGALSTDAAASKRLPLACISASGQARLRALIPNAATGNPIDITGVTNENPEILEPFLSTILREPDVGLLVMIHGSGMLWLDRARRIATVLTGLARTFGANRLVFVGSTPKEARDILEVAGVAVFDDPVALIRAMGCLPALFTGSAAPAAEVAVEGEEAPETAAATPPLLPEDEALDFLEARCGVPTVPRAVVSHATALHAAAGSLRFPLAMKAVIPGLAHKTESDALRLNLAGPADIDAAWAHLSALSARAGAPARILVEEMIGDAVAELLLSAFIDPLLGPFVTVGAGGTLTELLADVATAPAPLSGAEAAAMLRRLKGWPRLRRDRRGRRGNEAELVAAIVSLGAAIATHPDAAPGRRPIQEIEINPFLLRPEHSLAVDAIVRTAEAPPAVILPAGRRDRATGHHRRST